MRLDMKENIEIPEGVDVEIDGTNIEISKGSNKIVRSFKCKIEMEKKGNEIILESKSGSRREKNMIKTIKAHIKNMLKAVQTKVSYKMKVCNLHFPITVKVENGELIVSNFLGEKKSRKMKIPAGVDVKVNKDEITVEAFDKELVGRTSASFEKLTKVKDRDRRVFQDGIYIIEREGVPLA